MVNKLIAFVFLLPNFCYSKSLLLAHPISDQSEYQFKVQSESKYISYIQYQLSQQTKLSQSLAESFAQAREAELRNDLSLARSLYTEVIRTSERFIELSSQQVRLLKASFEILKKLSDSVVEAQHFEDQISKLNALFEGGSQKILWMPQDQLKDYDSISINGRLFEIKPGLRIPLSKGRYRVIALSNRYQPAYLNAGYTELMSWRPNSMPFIGGDCFSPQLLYPFDTEVQGFFGKKCISHFEEKEKIIPPVLKKKSQIQKPWILGAILLGAVVAYGLKDKEIQWQKP